MHESGLAHGVIHAVENRAGDRAVRRVGVRAGVFLRVVPEAFVQSFEQLAAGSIAEGADVELTIVPASARCYDCGTNFTTDDVMPACPACDGVVIQFDEEADDLVLEWLEYAEPQPAGANAEPTTDRP